MKRSAEVAFVHEEASIEAPPSSPHLLSIPNADHHPVSKPNSTCKIPRKPFKGTTTLRRGPTYLERDQAERAKAAAAAHWILNRSSIIPQSPQMSPKCQLSSNPLLHGSSVVGNDQPTTFPAVAKAQHRSNVIRRAKPSEVNQPEDVAVPTPRPTKKRKRVRFADDYKTEKTVPIVISTTLLETTDRQTNGPIANTISFSQSFIAASLNILSNLGLGRLVPTYTSIPTLQVETNTILSHVAQIDSDVEMRDAEADSTSNDKPASKGEPLWNMSTLRMVPYAQCPSSSTYEPLQWALLAAHPKLLRARLSEKNCRMRIGRTVWRANGYKVSDNSGCHKVRPMMRSPLSQEIFPEGEESSGLLTSHPSLASTASTMSVDPVDQVSVTPSVENPVKDVQYFPNLQNWDIHAAIRRCLGKVVENDHARYQFYPMFTGKAPGPENRDTLRKATLLTNWGHWLHTRGIWDLLWDRRMGAIMLWHNNYPAIPFPPISPYVVSLRGKAARQTVRMKIVDEDDDEAEMEWVRNYLAV